MNIVITTFNNLFSFHCIIDKDSKNVSLTHTIETGDIVNKTKSKLADVQHGQYVAVMWNNKWVRGVVSMEKQFLIWLIDYGIFLRPDAKTVYVDLPLEYKRLPTKIFEASIHGVLPVDKVLTEDCQIKNEISREWTKGAIDKAQELIANSKKLYFVPIAIISTDHNDIVLGDLYVHINGKKFTNIVDELQLWPVFLVKNVEAYVKNLPQHYTSRRKHRANQLKPHLANVELPKISLHVTLEYYNTLCEKALPLDTASASNSSECDSNLEDGSTVIGYSGDFKKEKQPFKLTPAEIEKYCNMYWTIHGREYNVLNVLLNKTRDLNICERYKDHDLKSIGRGITRRPSN